MFQLMVINVHNKFPFCSRHRYGIAILSRFFRLVKPMFLLFDGCNNDSYCGKGYGGGVRTRS